MAERRDTSLLDFAIAASIAVVPVMLVIVLLVAVIRPADPGAVSALLDAAGYRALTE